MSKVWMVTAGSYSDYRIVYAFDTEELADEFIERVEAVEGKNHEYMVEEYDLLTEQPPRTAVYRAHAYLDADGTLSDFRVIGELEDFGPSYELKPTEQSWQHRNQPTSLSVGYRGSVEEAQKAIFDLAARIKAERAGIG